MDVVIALAIFIAISYHLWRLGSYYIEYDGQTYTVWIRRFLGYNTILSGAYRLGSEEEARKCIERAIKNPPRTIKL